MSWTSDLANSVKYAITTDGNVRIAVHTEAQVELGKTAVGRICPARINEIQFELVTLEEQDLYPVGAILANY